MNGAGDDDVTGSPAAGPGSAKPVAFCQNCGKGLSDETKRVVGPAVYCEACLAARLGMGAGTPGYAGGTSAGGAVPGSAWSSGFVSPAWNDKGTPNPGLAALLGLIPGVGAMYNEQYPKGIAHLAIFAVLVLLTHVSDIFILFVFGWIAYMSIEAHHTARARRDGTPLPNPFGLNDIGERLGFGKAWPAGPGVGTVARDAAAAASAEFHSVSGGFGTRAASPAAAGAAAAADATAGAGWGAPVDAYASATGYGPGRPAAYPPGDATGYTPGYVPGDASGYVSGGGPGAGYAQASSPGYPQGSGGGYPQGSGPGYPQGAAYAQPGYSPVHSAYSVPQQSYQVPYAPPAAPPPPGLSRFPAGAIWLIGLGTIFLLGTTGIFNGFRGLALVGVVLLVLGVWTFVRRMAETGVTMVDDGSPMYRLRLLRALSGSVWLVLLGVLFLLDSFGWLRWENSWPWLIIAAGVLMLLKRAAYQGTGASYYPAPVAPAAAPAPAGSGSSAGAASIVPAPAGAALFPSDADLQQGGK